MRTLLALDRTLLAWDRTALTLIGCGFTLSKLVHGLMVSGTVVGVPSMAPRHIGIVLMALGILALIGGISEYVGMMKNLPTLKGKLSISLFVSVILAVVASWMTIILLMDLKPE